MKGDRKAYMNVIANEDVEGITYLLKESQRFEKDRIEISNISS